MNRKKFNLSKIYGEHVESGPCCSHKLTTFLKYHMLFRQISSSNNLQQTVVGNSSKDTDLVVGKHDRGFIGMKQIALQGC